MAALSAIVTILLVPDWSSLGLLARPPLYKLTVNVICLIYWLVVEVREEEGGGVDGGKDGREREREEGIGTK